MFTELEDWKAYNGSLVPHWLCTKVVLFPSRKGQTHNSMGGDTPMLQHDASWGAGEGQLPARTSVLSKMLLLPVLAMEILLDRFSS